MKLPPRKRKTAYSSLRRIARGLGLPLTVGGTKKMQGRYSSRKASKKNACPFGLVLAAENYMNAVKDLGEHDPVSKLTYFEESPSTNGECLWRWQQLNDTGKALSTALAEARAALPSHKGAALSSGKGKVGEAGRG